jgi:hypothetical protein
MSRKRKPTEEAIAALGGVPAVAGLFGFSERRIYNWRKRGFPPQAYKELAPRLRERGFRFDEAELFGQYEVVLR